MKKVWIALVVVAALSVRLVPYFWEYRAIGIDSYYHMRMAESFQGGYPTQDYLSYGGREYVYPPGIHMMLAPFPEAAPFVVTLIGVLIIIPVFFTARKLYGEKAGIMAAILIAFIPVHIWKTSSNVLVTAIDMTLLCAAFYFLLKKNFLYHAVISAAIFVFSPAVSIFSLLLYIPHAKKDIKTLLFIVLIAAEILIAYSLYGSALSIYTSSMPYNISSALYENIGLQDVLYRLSPLLMPLAIYGIWMSRKGINKPLLMWLAIVFVLFIASKIETDRGLAYMAVPLVIFSSAALATAKKNHIIIAILAVTSITGVYSLNNLRWGIVTDDEYAALNWIRDNTQEDAVVLAQFMEGHWVSGIANRKNVADPNLIGAPAAERLEEILSFYRNESIEVLKHNVSYVLYTKRAPQVGSRLEYFKEYDEVYKSGNIRVFRI